MPAKPRNADAERKAEALTEAFGGTWTAWESGPAGIPNAEMWTQVKPNADNRPVLTGLVVVADGITANGLRKIPVGVIESATAEAAAGDWERMRAELADLPPLQRGTLGAAEFSQLVARHYKVWARYSSTPAAGIAEEWGVKSATLHGWIRDARLRGLLPEAERGKRAKRPDA